MSDNFKYAPGKPGIGTKGRDGSTGLQGLGMYFTDFDPVLDRGVINARIINNSALWQLDAGNLPDGRTYSVGDLFVDQNGETYTITDVVTGEYSKIFANLSSGGFFLPLGVNTADGYERYFNSNTIPKIIIDNVYTDSGAINYTASPLSIYGIPPKEFARIEYSNVVINDRNPFTVYSSGTPAGTADDASAIAIVRETSGNIFRIGNLDDGGNLRNVNLIFDVSLLSQTKQVGNGFNATTPQGAILTNYEIDANLLFDPNFDNNPVSFTATLNLDETEATINWVLDDFVNDANIIGTLYFFQDNSPYSGYYNFDTLSYRPLVFEDMPNTGSIVITGLYALGVYGCYIKLSKNGWSRNSITKMLS
jgi:hypothetical protein